MKKILIFLLTICIGISTDMFLNAAALHWSYYIRPVATTLRNINEAMNTLIVSLKPAVKIYKQYGLNDYGTQVGTFYYRLQYGDFDITTGVANGVNNFQYLFSIENASQTAYYFKFYFNDLEDIYGTGALAVASNGQFNAAYLGIATEVYCYNDAGNDCMKISITKSGVSDGRASKSRAIAKKYSDHITVQVHTYANWTTPYTGYHTLAFYTNTSSGYTTTALMGAVTSADLSNNGYSYVSEGNSHNYGYFGITIFGGGAYIGEGSTPPSGYPATADVDTLYTDMTSNSSYYDVGGDISTLSIDVDNDGYDEIR